MCICICICIHIYEHGSRECLAALCYPTCSCRFMVDTHTHTHTQVLKISCVCACVCVCVQDNAISSGRRGSWGLFRPSPPRRYFFLKKGFGGCGIYESMSQYRSSASSKTDSYIDSYTQDRSSASSNTVTACTEAKN